MYRQFMYIRVMKEPLLQDVLEGAEKTARLRAFKNNLPYAVSRDGKVFLVYKDGKTEEITLGTDQADHLHSN